MALGLFAVIAIATASPPPGLELRFCPTGKARSYPLDTAHGASSLVVQGIAAINRGPAPTTIDSMKIELLRGTEVLDTRTITGADVARAAAGGKALSESGMLKAIAFQFCDGALLGNSKLAGNATLATGEAVMIMHQSFAWRGARDSVRVSVGNSSAVIPIDGAFAPPIRWPLRGGPWIVAGASFHTTHRWAVPEQFALDIIKADGRGKSHVGKGSKLRDFHAYGADVVAVGNGTVVAVTSASTEDAPMLRLSHETMDAYLGRVGAAQQIRLAGGEAAMLGESAIIDLGSNVFAVYAHLKPGSLKVKRGDRVAAGQLIAALGNSGNSTEPHLHFQLCDKPSGMSCASIPPAFDNIELPLADGPRPLQSGDVVIAE